MKSNKTVVLTAMVHYVSKGEVEFRDICETLRVSKSKQLIGIKCNNLQTQVKHEILTLIFLEKLVCCEFYVCITHTCAYAYTQHLDTIRTNVYTHTCVRTQHSPHVCAHAHTLTHTYVCHICAIPFFS